MLRDLLGRLMNHFRGIVDNKIKNNMSSHNETFIIYTDGGSRGNPGPSALGVYFPSLNKKYSEYLGTTTNNVAEYQAMVFALKKAKHLLGSDVAQNTHIEIRSDSQLIVNQLMGKFQLREEDLFQYFIALWNLKQHFESVVWVHIPREQNSVADAMVNSELDAHAQKGLF